MKRKLIAAINADRLSQWGKILVDHDTTPAVLVGVGHNQYAGSLQICVPEEISKAEIITILHHAIRLLKDDSTTTVIEHNEGEVSDE